MGQIKKGLIFILALILMCNFVLAANCPPSIPKIYSGVVKYNNTILSGNYEIRASNGDTLGIGNVINGVYSIYVSSCLGTPTSFSFYIGEVQAKEPGSYNNSGQTDWGVKENLNLTINSLPTLSTTCGNGNVESGEECDGSQLGTGTCENVLGINDATGTLSCTSYCTFDYSKCSAPRCGDSICNNGETCSTCSSDCGSCRSSGNGGSGSGGTTTNTVTTTNSASPATSNETPTINLTTKGNSAPITGGVIGNFVKSGGGIATILVLTTIVVLSIAITSMKKKKLTKEQKTKEF